MSFGKWVHDEIIHVLPAVIFFMITFNLINITETLMMRPLGGDGISYLTPTISALLVGKLLIIIDALPFINLFPGRPLIYNISWKVFFYGTAAGCVRGVDDFIHFYYQYKDISLVWLGLLERWTSPAFWAIQLWLFMLFAVYVTFRELSEALGDGKMKKLMIG